MGFPFIIISFLSKMNMSNSHLLNESSLNQTSSTILTRASLECSKTPSVSLPKFQGAKGSSIQKEKQCCSENFLSFLQKQTENWEAPSAIDPKYNREIKFSSGSSSESPKTERTKVQKKWKLVNWKVDLIQNGGFLLKKQDSSLQKDGTGQNSKEKPNQREVQRENGSQSKERSHNSRIPSSKFTRTRKYPSDEERFGKKEKNNKESSSRIRNDWSKKERKISRSISRSRSSSRSSPRSVSYSKHSRYSRYLSRSSSSEYEPRSVPRGGYKEKRAQGRKESQYLPNVRYIPQEKGSSRYRFAPEASRRFDEREPYKLYERNYRDHSKDRFSTSQSWGKGSQKNFRNNRNYE